MFIIKYRVTVNKFKNHQKDEIKIFYKKLIINSIVFVCLFALFLTLSLCLNKFGKNSSSKIVQANDEKFVNVNLSYSINDEEKKVFLELTKEKNIFCYVVKVCSNSLLPVYDSNYIFDPFSEKNKAVFYFEEYPPEKIELFFTSNNEEDLEIEIISYYKDENNQIFKNTTTKSIKGSSENARL